MIEGTAADWDLSNLDTETRDSAVTIMNDICNEALQMADNDLRDASDLVDGESKIDRLSNIATDIYMEVTDRWMESDTVLYAGGGNNIAVAYLKNRLTEIIAVRFGIDADLLKIGA